jgi:hypothetical protein
MSLSGRFSQLAMGPRLSSRAPAPFITSACDGRTFDEIAAERLAPRNDPPMPPNETEGADDPEAGSGEQDWIALCSPATSIAQEESK